jgi:hypothetical protein
MLKKLVISMLVSVMFLVPSLGFSHGVKTLSAKAGAESDMALLVAAVDGDAAFEAVSLSSDEMQAIEGARHKAWWRKYGRIVIQVVPLVVCATTGLVCPITW